MSSRGQIYTELPDVIAPQHSMLIVWDMQNALVNRAFNKSEILGPIQALLLAVRKLQVPVVYTRITPLPPRFQPPAAVASQMRRMGVKDAKLLPSLFGDDPRMKEIHEAITPLQEDMVLNKNTPDIFIGTNLDFIARHGGIKTLVFTGIATEFGIETSARHALALGYYVAVVSDAVSSANKDAHDRSLANLNIFCPVIPHSEILKVWR